MLIHQHLLLRRFSSELEGGSMINLSWLWLVSRVAISVTLAVAVVGCSTNDNSRTRAVVADLEAGDPLHVDGEGEVVFVDYIGERNLREMSRVSDRRRVRTLYFEDGSIEFLVNYLDERMNGAYRRWAQDGRLLECGQYQDGRPAGIWHEYDSEGVLKGKGTLGDPVEGKMGGRVEVLTMSFYKKGPDWVTFE